MPRALLALGSNLGDRPTQLRRAMLALARLRHTTLLARSAWQETQPVGGPADQAPFLNAAALLDTALPAPDLLAELHQIERRLGRTAAERWAARAIDLDLLLYDRGRASLATGDSALTTDAPVAKAFRPLPRVPLENASPLILPHPRLTYRRFALEPAAEIAPWMLHAESGWTISRLLEHLNTGPNAIAVAGADQDETSDLVAVLADQINPPPGTSARAQSLPLILSWSDWALRHQASIGDRLPKLILALRSPADADLGRLRATLHLPARGPVAWIGADATLTPQAEACAAIQSLWPASAR